MNKLFIGIVAAFVVAGAILLFSASQAGTSVVYLPSQLFSQSEPSRDLSRIRVGGKVASEAIEYRVEPSIELRFSIQDPGKVLGGPAIPVVYNGIKPDMFASGRDVIIDGDYIGGVLMASKLLTQCPSKYEAPAPDKLYPQKD